MTARPVKQKDPLYKVAVINSGGKCQAGKKLQFGATDMHGDPNGSVVQRCGMMLEGIYYLPDSEKMIALCNDCRMRILGTTSGENRKRRMAFKAAQMPLLVRDKGK